MSDQEKMRNALREATAIIDLLYSLRPPAWQFNELATEAIRVMHNVFLPLDIVPDMFAEYLYQFSRISELAGETHVFPDPDYKSRLTMAREHKEQAVEYSK